MVTSFLCLFENHFPNIEISRQSNHLAEENGKYKSHMTALGTVLPSPRLPRSTRADSWKPSEGWSACRLHPLWSGDGYIVVSFSRCVGQDVKRQTVRGHLKVRPKKNKLIKISTIFETNLKKSLGLLIIFWVLSLVWTKENMPITSDWLNFSSWKFSLMAALAPSERQWSACKIKT